MCVDAGCGVKQEVLATEETPQALPQANFNSQEYIAYCRQQQQAFSSLVFPARYSADAPLIFCFYTTQKKDLNLFVFPQLEFVCSMLH